MARGISQKSSELIAVAHAILSEIHPSSVRMVCYQLFTRKLLASMRKNETDKVSRLLKGARERGEIPWAWIVDENREAERPNTWNDPAEFAAVMQRQFRKDRWQYQKAHVEVWSEKGTIRGTISGTLYDYGVTFRSTGGFNSTTGAWDMARESDFYQQVGKPFIALYLGDWDPSGLRMSELDLPDRIKKYKGKVEFRRIALTAEDLPGLPSFPLETKKKDSRYQWYRNNYGHSGKCWELDAMDPRVLRERVKNAILEYIELDAWNRCAESEAAQQESLAVVLNNWATQYA